MMIAPALRKLATGGLSGHAIRSLKATTPLVVGRPAQSTLILIVTGTPWSELRGSPLRTVSSAQSASASASSARRSTTAQAGERAGQHFDRCTLDRAGEVVFRLTGRQIFEAGNEQRRVLAVDHGDGAGVALLPVFPGDDRAVSAFVVELYGDPILAVDLYAVDRAVDPAGVGIAHDD